MNAISMIEDILKRKITDDGFPSKYAGKFRFLPGDVFKEYINSWGPSVNLSMLLHDTSIVPEASEKSDINDIMSSAELRKKRREKKVREKFDHKIAHIIAAIAPRTKKLIEQMPGKWMTNNFFASIEGKVDANGIVRTKMSNEDVQLSIAYFLIDTSEALSRQQELAEKKMKLFDNAIEDLKNMPIETWCDIESIEKFNHLSYELDDQTADAYWGLACSAMLLESAYYDKEHENDYEGFSAEQICRQKETALERKIDEILTKSLCVFSVAAREARLITAIKEAYILGDVMNKLKAKSDSKAINAIFEEFIPPLFDRQKYEFQKAYEKDDALLQYIKEMMHEIPNERTLNTAERVLKYYYEMPQMVLPAKWGQLITESKLFKDHELLIRMTSRAMATSYLFDDLGVVATKDYFEFLGNFAKKQSAGLYLEKLRDADARKVLTLPENRHVLLKCDSGCFEALLDRAIRAEFAKEGRIHEGAAEIIEQRQELLPKLRDCAKTNPDIFKAIAAILRKEQQGLSVNEIDRILDLNYIDAEIASLAYHAKSGKNENLWKFLTTLVPAEFEHKKAIIRYANDFDEYERLLGVAQAAVSQELTNRLSAEGLAGKKSILEAQDMGMAVQAIVSMRDLLDEEDKNQKTLAYLVKDAVDPDIRAYILSISNAFDELTDAMDCLKTVKDEHGQEALEKSVGLLYKLQKSGNPKGIRILLRQHGSSLAKYAMNSNGNSISQLNNIINMKNLKERDAALDEFFSRGGNLRTEEEKYVEQSANGRLDEETLNCIYAGLGKMSAEQKDLLFAFVGHEKLGNYTAIPGFARRVIDVIAGNQPLLADAVLKRMNAGFNPATLDKMVKEYSPDPSFINDLPPDDIDEYKIRPAAQPAPQEQPAETPAAAPADQERWPGVERSNYPLYDHLQQHGHDPYVVDAIIRGAVPYWGRKTTPQFFSKNTERKLSRKEKWRMQKYGEELEWLKHIKAIITKGGGTLSLTSSTGEISNQAIRDYIISLGRR
ncbi:MAG: hypothetical protein QXM31_03090 [Candidatus Woesearchaeota archaeon]